MSGLSGVSNQGTSESFWQKVSHYAAEAEIKHPNFVAAAETIAILPLSPLLLLPGCDCGEKEKTCIKICCNKDDSDDTTPADDDTTLVDDDTTSVDDDTTPVDDDTASPCKEGMSRLSYSGPAETRNVGICQDKIEICEDFEWVVSQEEVLPQEEIGCNDFDEDCDGITLSGIFGKIGPDVRISNDGFASQPSLVWTDTGYGVVWNDHRDGNSEIYFTRLSDTGTEIGSDVRVTNDGSYSDAPSLVWTENGYGVVWVDGRDGNSEIYFALLSDTGTKIGPDIRLTNDSGASEAPSLVWIESGYGVAWNEYRNGNFEICFARLSNTGTKIGADVCISSPSMNPSLVWTGTEYGTAWNDILNANCDIYFTRFSDTGTPIGPDVRVTNDSSCSANPSLVLTENGFGVAWNDYRDGNAEIYFSPLSNTGTPIGPDVRVTNDNSDSMIPKLVWADSKYGVSWSDHFSGNWGYYFARLSDAGTMIGENICITNDGGNVWDHSLVWADGKYGVSWTDMRDGNPEIYFARIGCQ